MPSLIILLFLWEIIDRSLEQLGVSLTEAVDLLEKDLEKFVRYYFPRGLTSFNVFRSLAKA